MSADLLLHEREPLDQLLAEPMHTRGGAGGARELAHGEGRRAVGGAEVVGHLGGDTVPG